MNIKAKSKITTSIMAAILIAVAVLLPAIAQPESVYAGGTMSSWKAVQDQFRGFPVKNPDKEMKCNRISGKELTWAQYVANEGGIGNIDASVVDKWNDGKLMILEFTSSGMAAIEKTNLRVQNTQKPYVPTWFNCDYQIQFELVKKYLTGTPMIIVRKDLINSSFSIVNCEAVNVEITFSSDAADMSTTLPMALGFGDIDIEQSIWASKADMTSSSSGFANKYWYGSKVDAGGSNSTWLKFDGTEPVNSDPQSRAIVGMNVREDQSASFRFFSGHTGSAAFVAEFLGQPENRTYTNTIVYDPTDYEHKDDKGEYIKHEWASGGSALYKEKQDYLSEVTVTGKEIKDAVTVQKEGEYTKTTTWKFAGMGDKAAGWFDDKGVNKTYSFGQNGTESYKKKRASWLPDTEHTVYAKYVPDVDVKVEQPDAGIEPAAVDMGMSSGYEYRTTALTAMPGGTVKREGTDVIFSVWAKEGGKSDIYEHETEVNLGTEEEPDIKTYNSTDMTVKFTCLGNTYTVTGVQMPKSGKQLVWFKFHTPSSAQTFSVSVTASYTFMDQPVTKTATFPVRVVEPGELTPPDPRAQGADGKAIKKPASFSASAAAPAEAEVLNKTWSVYKADSDGNFTQTNYSSSVATKKMRISANEYVPTAKDAGLTIKSGYGFDAEVETQVNGTPAMVSPFQNGRFVFPEFNYATYDRLAAFITQTSLAASTSLKTQHFSVNKYSPHAQEAHFTPLWYPDGTYKVYGYLRDAWTPMGELKANVSAQMNISGDLYDDWHVAPQS